MFIQYNLRLQRHQYSLPPTAFFSLIFCILLHHTSAAALVTSEEQDPARTAFAATPAFLPKPAAPLATTTVPYRLLNVQSWPLPTEEPVALATMMLEAVTSPADLRRFLVRNGARVDRFNTICGYIGGDPELPATCSAGSHCVLDSEHSAVGCCPNGVDICTTGVFTGCVDGNSGVGKTEVNPYVYTCSTGSVCYKNTFPGGYFQYGCGSASTMGQSVAAVALGKPTLIISSERVSFTGTHRTKSSSTKSSLKTSSTKSSSSTTSTLTTKSSASISPVSSTSVSSHSPSTGLSSSSDPGNETNAGSKVGSGAGVIIGATISGIAGLVALIAITIFFCWKRRRGAVSRKGPAGFRTASGNFQPIQSNPDDYESALNPDMTLDSNATGIFMRISAGGPFSPQLPEAGEYKTPFQPGSESENITWPTPAIGPNKMSAPAGTGATARAASLALSRRSSGGTSSILSRDAPQRHSYRGVVTNATVSGAGSAPTSSLLSRVASKKAVYTQISQQSPYDDIGVNSPLQHAFSDNVAVFASDSTRKGRAVDGDNDRINPDQLPLSRELDEYLRGPQDTLDRICEEDDLDDPGCSSNMNVSTANVKQDVCTTSRTEDSFSPQTNRADATSDGTVGALSSGNCSTSSSSVEPTSHSTRESGGTAFDDSTLSGTKRGSSGVLPVGENPHSNQPQLIPLELRGGGSSGVGSPTPSEVSSCTTDGTTKGTVSLTGMRNSEASDHGLEAGHRSGAASRSDDQLSLDMTSPSLSLDGQMIIGEARRVYVGSVSPPAAALATGAPLLSPPASPPMRPLWQQNRQKSRKLTWS
ncbi:hypothetical protein SEPCBS57363_006293 [Sporothrix epigloea]|uniref:Uncharacterized protein n=1 Tax=Sporothrix epigloea TaxID=1892477 RepID=A0ABP0E488_9PEZI